MKSFDLVDVYCEHCWRLLGRILSGLVYCRRCQCWTDSAANAGRESEQAA